MKRFFRFLSKNKHLYLLLLVPLYLIYFFVVERLSPTEGYWVSYVPEDDKIPFVEWFVIFYVLWYPLLVGVALPSIMKEPAVFRRYMIMLIVPFLLSVTFGWIFPNGQDLRPETFPRDNVFTKLIGMLYGSDTNTNVIPSMHVLGCMAAAFTTFDSKRFPWWARTVVIVFGLLICASTVLIKQHSILDFYVALPVGFAFGALVYGKRILTALKERKNTRVAAKESASFDPSEPADLPAEEPAVQSASADLQNGREET